MKNLLKPFQFVFLLLSFGFLSASAHSRIIKGTVYREGKPAAGVLVTVDKSKSMYYTSFDGKYELKANAKSKCISFTFSDKAEKLNLDEKSGNIIDFGTPAQQKTDHAPAALIQVQEQLQHSEKDPNIR